MEIKQADNFLRIQIYVKEIKPKSHNVEGAKYSSGLNQSNLLTFLVKVFLLLVRDIGV